MEKSNKAALIKYFQKNDDSWKEYADKKGFIEYVSPIGIVTLNEQDTEIHSTKLPFYEKGDIIRVTHTGQSEKPEYFFFIKSDNDLVFLDGNAEMVREANAIASLKLEYGNVIDYLKFYALFMIGEQGCFYLIEGRGSEFMASLSNFDRDRTLKGYNGPSIIQDVNNGKFRISVRVLYGHSYYDCVFSIPLDGAAAMEDDKFYRRA